MRNFSFKNTSIIFLFHAFGRVNSLLSFHPLGQEAKNEGNEFTFKILGKELINKTINGVKIRVDLATVNSGIYFYSIKGNNFETITGKIIKQ